MTCPSLLTLALAATLTVCASQPPHYERQRQTMVSRDLAGRDIADPRVLGAMGKVPREEFVPESLRQNAYADHPLPIGGGQTISQPYIVALMTQLAGIEASARVLEIGTGSGYQAAVLAELAREVYTIEIVEELASSARLRLERLGYKNVQVRHGDGYQGWPDKQPFGAIVVTAAPDQIPEKLVEQLAPGGRMVVPVGPVFAVQMLKVVEKGPDGKVKSRDVVPVRFVPMIKGRSSSSRQSPVASRQSTVSR